MLVIAHRGDSKNYPECTLLAIRKAAEADPDFIEIDVQMSRDGIPMIFHGDDLSEVTVESGRVVDRTAEELRRISVRAGFGDHFGFQPIPTLEEVLDVAEELGLRLCVEMKDDKGRNWDEYVDQVMPPLLRKGLAGRVVVNTSNPPFIRACRGKYPSIPLVKDFSDCPLEEARRSCAEMVEEGIQIVEYKISELRPELVHELNCHGIAVWAWPVNTEAELAKAAACGSAGILTDEPSRITALARSARRGPSRTPRSRPGR